MSGPAGTGRTAKRLGFAAAVAVALLVGVDWRFSGPVILFFGLVPAASARLRAAVGPVLSITWRYLMRCRFSVFALVVGSAVFTLTGQGGEGLRAIGEGLLDGGFWPYVHAAGFLLAVAYWAFTTWYWARIAYSTAGLSPATGPDPLEQFYRRHVPRMLGTGAFAAVTIGFVKTAIALDTGQRLVLVLTALAALTAMLGGMFYYVVLERRAWARKRLERIDAGTATATGIDRFFLDAFRESSDELYARERMHRSTAYALSASGLFGLLCLVLAAAVPVTMGSFLGADVVILLGVAAWVPAFGALTLPIRRDMPDRAPIASYVLLVLAIGGGIALDRAGGDFLGQSADLWTIVLLAVMAIAYLRLVFRAPGLDKAPILSVAILGGLLFSFWNDNHLFRPVANEAGLVPAPRRWTVGEAFDLWRKGRCETAGCPMVVVATAGGGLRAALWTADVLGRVEDAVPGFADRLFAMSGVSGGALGATVFRALLTRAVSGGPVAQADATRLVCDSGTGFAACGEDILGRDFLGPTLAAMFFPEAVQRFLPFSTQRLVGDRAAALERSWEVGWSRSFKDGGGTNRLAGPFSSLWRPDEPWPALLLNGTVVESARRIIASNLCVEEGRKEGTPVFREAYGFFAEAKHDVPVSTAANVAARFPYVEPAGTLRRATYDVGGQTQSAECGPRAEGVAVHQGPDWRHVVDGGYFENFGVATAIDVLNQIRRTPDGAWARLRPIVVLISSDPDFTGPPNYLGPGDALSATKDNPCVAAKDARPLRARQWANELLSPPAAFLSLRGAVGCSAAWQLRSWVVATARATGRFFHFRLTRAADGSEPALGWLLSDKSRADVADQLCRNTANGNLATFKALVEALGATFDPKMCS